MEAASPQVAPEELRARIDAGRAVMAGVLRDAPCGRAACAAFSDVFDQLVTELWTAAVRDLSTRHADRFALVATGGWGRREMCPYSDLDFILLHARGADEHAKQISERLLYPLWDAGIKVVPTLDTPRARARLARKDLPTATGLLDCRHIAGERSLTDSLLQLARRHVAPSGNANAFLDTLSDDRRRRHDRFGDSLYLLEPDLKHGIGALRDLCTALWAMRARWWIGQLQESVTMGLVSPRHVELLQGARDFFLALRSLVQIEAGRSTDRLTFEVQESIATRLYPVVEVPAGDIRPAVAPAVETLMQRFYVHARAVVQVTDRTLENTRVPARRKPRIYRIDSTFLSWGGRLAIRDPEIFRDHPGEMYRLFRVALDRGLPIYGHTKELIADNLHSAAIRQAIADDPECGRLFMEALVDARDDRQPSLLEQMHELGLLSAVIPEFEPCTCRVQHDLYHVYTVDQHQLYTVAMLKKIERGELEREHPTATEAMLWIPDRSGLYLGTLLHDVGKPLGKGHAEKGARLTAVAARRLGMASDQADVAEFLVRQHLTMAHLSQRRDLSDPDVITRFASRIGDEVRLASLYICTLCDTAMTSPGNLSAWKNELLQELFLRGWADLSGESAPLRRRDLEDEANRARERVVELLCPMPERDVEPGANPGDAAGRAADPGDPDHDEDAAAGERARIAAFVAGIDERFFSSLSPRQLARQVRLAWKHEASDSPVEISVTEYPLKGHSELAIAADDVRGLLATIAGALAANRVSVLGAVIGNLRPRSAARSALHGDAVALDAPAGSRDAPANVALDLFYVRDLYGRAIPGDDPRWKRFRDDLCQLVAGVPGDERSGAVETLLARRRPRSGLAPRVTPGVPTAVKIDNDSSADATVVEVLTRDRVGVLHAITNTLTELGLDIHLSRIATEGERVADSFYVTGGQPRQKIVDPLLIEELEARLHESLASLTNDP